MKREYKDGTENSEAIKFFVGIEEEKTAAYKQKTLFVVGFQPVNVVLLKAQEAGVTHVYLGANKSFHQNDDWHEVIDQLIHSGYWVTLDYPVRSHNTVMRLLGNQLRHSRFIPMISVEIPNIEAYNYNTVLKIDDIGFDETNPGVWCHHLYDLMDREKFTWWDCYKDDEPL